MTTQQKSSYDDSFKRQAIQLGIDIGPAQAAAQLNIPQGTLSCWIYKHRRAFERGDCWPSNAAHHQPDPQERTSAADTADSDHAEPSAASHNFVRVFSGPVTPLASLRCRGRCSGIACGIAPRHRRNISR